MTNNYTSHFSKAIIATLAVLFVTGMGAAATYDVGGVDSDHSSVQAAVDNAAAGDLIEVYSGSYDGFTVNEALEIRAASGENPVVDGVATGSDVMVEVRGKHGNGVTNLTGLTFENATDSSYTAISVAKGSSDVNLKSNTIKDFQAGILTKTSYEGNLDVIGNTLEGTVDVGIAAQAGNENISKNTFNSDSNMAITVDSDTTVEDIYQNDVSITDEVTEVHLSSGSAVSGSGSNEVDYANYVLSENPGVSEVRYGDIFNGNTYKSDIEISGTYYATIQQAVDNAASGDTITVEDGEYNQTVIDRDVHPTGLTLRAAEGATPTISRNVSNGQPTVAIDQDGVTVEGIDIERSDSGSSIAQAVKVVGDNIDLVDNTYTVSGQGDGAVAVTTDSSGAAGNPDVSGLTINDVDITGGEIITNSDAGVGLIAYDAGEASFGSSDPVVDVSDVEFTSNSDAVHAEELATDGTVFGEESIVNNNDFDRAAVPNETSGTDYGLSVEGAISSTVQDAINYADTGARVEVKAGTYDEQVEVTTDGVTLEGTEGADNTVIQADLRGQQDGVDTKKIVLDVYNTSGVTIDGFTIRDSDLSSNPGGEAFAVLVRSDSDSFTLKNSIIEDIRDTARATGVGINSFRNNPDSDTTLIDSPRVVDNVFKDIKATKYDPDVNSDSKSKAVGFNGNVVDAMISQNEFMDIGNESTQKARGLSITEATINSSPIGPTNFTVTENSFESIQGDFDGSSSVEGPATIFIGSYDNLGSGHEMRNNSFLDGIVRKCCGSSSTNLDASHNYWGAASGPANEGDGAGVNVSKNVTYKPWLLEADGKHYDETIKLDGGDWSLVSPPKEADMSKSDVRVDDGGTSNHVVYDAQNEEWASPSGSEANPLGASFILSNDDASVGFIYTGSSKVSKDVYEGWNMISSTKEIKVQDALSPIGNSLNSFYAPDAFNARKGDGFVGFESKGDMLMAATSLSDLQSRLQAGQTVSPYDGYWVKASGQATLDMSVPQPN